MTDQAHRAAPPTRRAVLALTALAFGLAAFYLLTMSGHDYARDEETLYYVTESLVEERDFTIPTTAPVVNAAVGRDGQRHGQHPPGQAVLAVPLYLIGKLAAAGAPPDLQPFVTRLHVQTFNVWVTALLCVTLAVAALSLGASLRLGLLLGLLLGLTTMQWIYARTFFAEPLTALLTLVSFLSITRFSQTGRARWLVLSGLAAGAGLLVKPHMLAAWPGLGLYLVLTLGWPEQRWRWPNGAWLRARGWPVTRGLLLWGAGWLPLVLLMLLYNTLIYGHPLVFGNTAGGPVEWDAPLHVALYGITLSTGKGIIFYAPLAVAGLVALYEMRRTHRWAAWSIWLLLLLNGLVIHRYGVWWGGGSWGPRYVLLVLPFLLLPLAPWLQAARGNRPRWAGIAALALAGLVVQGIGAWTNFATVIQGDDPAEYLWEPPASPIILQARLAAERWQVWQNLLRQPAGSVLLLAGYSYEGLEESRQQAVAPVRALPELVLRVQPADDQPMTLRLTTEASVSVALHLGGQPLTPVAREQPTATTQRVAWAVPSSGRLEPRLLIRPTPGRTEPGLPLVTALEVQQGQRRFTLLAAPYIPPMPSAPLRRWQWFYVPNIPHLTDHWLWYLYVSGVPTPRALAIAAPLLVTAALLLAGLAICLWRLRPRRGIAHPAPEATPAPAPPG